MSREPASAPKERPDTSIVRQGYDHRDTAPKGLKDRRIFARPNIRPLSTGLSDLPMMAFSPHSPALRFGLCWYHVGLSALAHGMAKPAPKVRLDTSIARQGYDLKDRRIIPRVAASVLFTPT